jgi:serine protease Do
LKPKFRLSLLAAAAFAALLVAGCSSEDQAGPKEENVAQAPAQASSRVPDDEPVAQVASQVEPSVVQVNVRAIQTTPLGPQEQDGLGSGVIYRQDGYIITNNHVVEGASEVNVAFADGSVETGEVVGNDPATDLAVVRVDRDDLPAASFNEDEDLVPGQLAVAIGSPSGFQSTVTSGVISGLNREIPGALAQGERALVDLIQTDAAISPGNSGGALVDRDGEVIGINVAYLPQTQSGAPVQGLGFAIPADTAISVADQLIETGRAVQPYLGIQLSDLSPEAAEQFGLEVESGVVVAAVEPGFAAEEAGLQEGDIITTLEDTPIEDSGDLLGALRDYQPGDEVRLTVVRDGNEQTFDVTLDERPQQP